MHILVMFKLWAMIADNFAQPARRIESSLLRNDLSLVPETASYMMQVQHICMHTHHTYCTYCTESLSDFIFLAVTSVLFYMHTHKHMLADPCALTVSYSCLPKWTKSKLVNYEIHRC